MHATRSRPRSWPSPPLLSSIYSSNAGYIASAHKLSAMAFATDNVFSDGTALAMTTMQANTGGGYTTSVTISIAACPLAQQPVARPQPHRLSRTPPAKARPKAPASR